MSWAMERRIIVFFVFLAILAVVAALAYYLFFYRAPSCKDGIQNQDESGPDCGGSCPYLCNAELEAPTVLFTKALDNGAGRTDVIALVENKNQSAAAKSVPYALSVFGYDQTLIQRVTGTLELPPGATVPVFVTGILSGKATPGTSFLSIDANAVEWYTLAPDPRILPRVGDVVLAGATSSPRITATLSNASVTPLRDVKVIALVRDGAGNAVAASQTILPTIPAQGSATATFTWSTPFPGEAVQIQILPRIPLP